LEEAAEALQAEHAAQKARKEMETKMREEAEKQRIVKKKEEKKDWNISNNSGTRYWQRMLPCRKELKDPRT